MRLIKMGAVAGALLTSAMALPAFAHHSFAAEFDINRPISLDGTVTEMEFSNPHSWLHLEVTTDSGKKQEWMVEGGAPNALVRRGWNRNSVQAGTRVHVEGFQARDRSFRASGRTITLSNGKSLFMGSVGLGTPKAASTTKTGDSSDNNNDNNNDNSSSKGNSN